jgi:hypothetical protein
MGVYLGDRDVLMAQQLLYVANVASGWRWRAEGYDWLLPSQPLIVEAVTKLITGSHLLDATDSGRNHHLAVICTDTTATPHYEAFPWSA